MSPKHPRRMLLNDHQSAILNFISEKVFMVVLCESLHFVLPYMHGAAILFCF